MFPWLYNVIPGCANGALLVFVGLLVGQQAFEDCPKRHYPALLFGLMPCVANWAKLYVDPGALVYQARELLRWPADMALGAQAILGASLATIAVEFALLTAVAAYALARVDGQVRTGAELAQIPIEAVQPA